MVGASREELQARYNALSVHCEHRMRGFPGLRGAIGSESPPPPPTVARDWERATAELERLKAQLADLEPKVAAR